MKPVLDKARKRGCLFRVARLFVLFVALILIVAYFYLVLPLWGMPFNGQRHGAPPLTPLWAFEPWLWEDDVNTAEEVLRLVKGYEDHDIPVRTILIDSPWSLRYNDFALDEERYPASFYTGLQERDYRVVLWMTCMINGRNKDTHFTGGPEAQSFFDEARDKGYLAANGAHYGWWKGHGGFIDYTNADAMTWWRGLQEEVFALGIDGWKLDGTATFFRSQLGRIPLLYGQTAGGFMTTRGYMDHYYRDEYEHGLTKNPEFITLSRSYDRSPHPEGFSPIDATPVAWVGDQDHTWSLEDEGLEEALEDVMKSIEAGYSVVGSDIGGYGGGTIPPELYIRWTQWSTFCGWFSNGGHGNRALWERSDEELEIIRKFTWLRQELVPYIYTHARAHHEGGEPLMRRAPGDYQYYFGPDFLVAPIYKEIGNRPVRFPAGRWRYLFNPIQVHEGFSLLQLDALVDFEGPGEFNSAYALEDFPVFVREGAVIPLDVKRDYTGFGDRSSEGAITWLIFPGENGSGEGHLTRENGDVASLAYAWEGGVLNITCNSENTRDRIRVQLEGRPTSVTDGTKPITGRDSYDETKQHLWITLAPDAEGIVRIAP